MIRFFRGAGGGSTAMLFVLPSALEVRWVVKPAPLCSKELIRWHALLAILPSAATQVYMNKRLSAGVSW
jgi:hypothetical protein